MSSPSAPRSIADLLWSAADSRGERVAIVSSAGTLTYAALRSRATDIAAALSARGVVAGDRVAILAERGPEAAAAYFGALAAGATVVVVNERLRPRQIEYVLDQSGARVLLTTGAMLAEHQRELATSATVVDLAEVTAAEASGESAAPATPRDGALAQIIFTSGSTGMPKGVMFTHRAMLTAIDAVVRYLELRDDERILSLLPFSSVYGINQLLCAVRTGSALVTSTSPLPATIVAEAAAQEVTVMAGVPPLWLQLLAVPAFATTPMPTLRVLQNAGGHLPVDAVKRLRAAQPHARLYLQYGMTETFRSSYLPPSEVDEHPGSMGRPLPGATVWVIDEDGQACGPGEVGELVFGGPTLSEGYWNDPVRTALVFHAPPEVAPVSGASLEGVARVVHSGDLVRHDGEGRLFYVSRRDRTIKSLGFRIGPDEIVDVLFASGDVQEAAVGTEPDPARGDRIIAFVVLRPDGDRAHLERYCRFELPRHMQPARIETFEALPRLASGKYDMAAMLATRGRAGASA